MIAVQLSPSFAIRTGIDTNDAADRIVRSICRRDDARAGADGSTAVCDRWGSGPQSNPDALHDAGCLPVSRATHQAVAFTAAKRRWHIATGIRASASGSIEAAQEASAQQRPQSRASGKTRHVHCVGPPDEKHHRRGPAWHGSRISWLSLKPARQHSASTRRQPR